MTSATIAARRGGLARCLAWLIVAGLVLWVWPPFHVQRLRGSARAQLENRPAREARRIADRLWNSTLATVAAKPIDIRLLVELLQESPAVAQRYGHTADYGGNPAYFLEGTGRVTSMDDTGAWLDVGARSTLKVVLLVGPIFGNALRDSTGRLPTRNLSFSQLDAVSEELDRLSETEGQAGLREHISVGVLLHIVAAGEVDDSRGYPVLELAPIRITLQ